MPTYESLVNTADNLQRYSDIYNKHRKNPFDLSISFTGGEPTVSPAFFKFLEYLTTSHPTMRRTLTTNGFYSTRRLHNVMENTNFTTVSYHCEGTPEQKAQVRENLLTMKANNYPFKVNVMFHQKDEYFQECIDLCKWLDDEGMKYTPRIIGDQGEVKEGLEDATVHVYNETQMAWFKQYWASQSTSSVKQSITTETLQRTDEKKDKNIIGQSMGRPCCGGRQFEIMNDAGEWTPTKFSPLNNFKGWSCMVNWYFLYIHQEIDQIWHHQTCQVNLDSKVGPICKASELGAYCDKLEDTIAKTNSMPVIRCPKSYCGCGLCTPKAKTDDRALAIWDSHITGLQPALTPVNTQPILDGTLRNLVDKFDSMNGTTQ